MNLSSQTAPQTRTFQSWHWIFLATILLVTVAITISTFYFATVQAESHGAITGLTLASDAPGTLTVSWDAASPTPTDYRVDWAKSDEDYQSWKVDEGHKYPSPTVTAVTITDLGHDTEYKIRMRARYYKGEHEGKSWGGPWATATITVAGEPAEAPTPEPAEEDPVQQPPRDDPAQQPPKEEPVQQPPRDDPAQQPLPAAPSFINTAVSGGRVLLSWSNPSDDSITGYQILRGPDADNLVVIEDDTESNSTSYTDTAPPAGQTHTYGVKARNTSGLSPAGTATATVPAAEEELITARHGSTSNTLVSNLGQTFSSEGAITGTYAGSYKEHAIAFKTGANPLGYHVTTAQLTVKEFPGEGIPNPDLSIRADDGDVPGETVLYTFTATSAVTASWNLLTFATTDNFTLRPNTTYWLYTTTMGTISMFIRGTESEAEDAESNTDWRIGNARYFRADGGTWTQGDGFKLWINITGHAAPAFLVSNLDSPSALVLFSRRTDADVSKFAQAFSAANNENGTPAEFDFHGVIVQLESAFSTPSQLADSDILVTVHKDSGGQPGDLVYTLTSPATYTVPVPSGPVTFLAPPGSTLSSGITYWLKFEIAADSTFFTGLKRIDFEFATDNNEVQGPTTYNRWTIRHDSLWSPETLAWTHEVKSIKMSVLGSQSYKTLVSNIDQPFRGAEQIGLEDRVAQAFLTRPGPPGQQHRLYTVHINAASEFPTEATVDLHADDDGAPGDHLASMILPGDFAPGELTTADLITVAPPHTNLNPKTRYWIVISNEPQNNVLRISLTESKAEDSTSLNGWTISDRRARKEPDQPWSDVAYPIQMEVLGSAPFFRTDELAPLLVSNLGQSTGTLISADYDERTAQAFVAGPSRVGFDYRFQGIRVSASGVSTFNQFRMPQVRASLHRDGGGIPGARLHTLTMPDDFASTVEYEDYTLSAPPGTVLRGGARYWVVFEVLDHTLYLEGTSSADEDPRLDAWSIDNYSYIKQASGGWVRVARVTDVIPRIIKLAVLGSPLWVTDEANGPDLPGAGHNAHETNGVVMPGIVSTGHLTPGLDKNHGLYGDYWWLDTETGHSYRIEVEFGDSQNNDTGGSAWMSFIDPDHEDYPYASGCCEADHNRDDGHTFVHFRRPTDDWNNRYLVHIATFDKLNTDSRTYNGPYTITMTDITGTKKVATNLYLGDRVEGSHASIGENNQYAVSFTTGGHAAGYKLDRVRMHVLEHEAQPDMVLYANSSGLPGDGICDLLQPNQVQHHRPYAGDNHLPVTFRAAHCGDEALLDANTTYWMVLEGEGYSTVFTDNTDQQTRGSGWTIGDISATIVDNALWIVLPFTGPIPVEIWASPA